MKQFVIVFLLGLMLGSCVKEMDKTDEVADLACNVENPLEELDWLQDVKNSITNCSCQVSILQGKYKSKTVFFVLVNDPLCNGVFHVVLLDCNGDKVKEYKHDERDIYAQEVEIVKSIYICKDE